MSLIHADGFEYDPQSLNENMQPSLGFGKATSLSAQAVSIAGRRAISKALSLPASSNGGYSKTMSPTYSEIWMGAAIRVPSPPASSDLTLFNLADSTGAARFYLNVSPSGVLLFSGNSSGNMAYSANAIAFGVWNFIELHVVASHTSGVVEIKVNGVLWATLYGANTSPYSQLLKVFGLGATLSTDVNEVQIDFDDFYVADQSGAYNHTWLGDIRVDVLRPTAAGTYTQFGAMPTGNNFDRVNEAVVDLTDYVQSTATGQQDSYTYADVPAMNTPNILAVQVASIAKKTDSGAANLKHLVRNGGSTVLSTGVPLTTYSASVTTIYETNPVTVAPWTETTVNSSEFGVGAA